MDDRDLEVRLSARLHARFDDAMPGKDLVDGVAQILQTPSRRVGAFDWPAVRAVPWGWSRIAIGMLAAFLAVAAFGLRAIQAPGGPGPSPSPSSVIVERYFLVMPPSSVSPPWTVSSVAADVLARHLRDSGIEVNVSGAGDAVLLLVTPQSGPSDDQIRSTLAAALAGNGLRDLPPAWRGGTVIKMIPRNDAVARAIQEFPGNTLQWVMPWVERSANEWRPLWHVGLAGSFRGQCNSAASGSPPRSCDEVTGLVKIDAVTGQIVSTVVPAATPPT